jgi:hypothetical protein
MSSNKILFSTLCCCLLLLSPGCERDVTLPTVVDDGGEVRVLLSSKVEGKSVRLAVDTASFAPLVLFNAAAERIGLSPAGPIPASETPGLTSIVNVGPYSVSLVGEPPRKMYIGIADLSSEYYGGIDGMVGWPVVRQNRVLFSLGDREVRLANASRPSGQDWIEMPLIGAATIFTVSLDGADRHRRMSIDTGSPHGVGLGPEEWKRWRPTAEGRLTLRAYSTPGHGVVVSEVGWARELKLGPLLLKDVTVMPSGPSETDFAVLGTEALRQLDVFVDGAAGIASFRPRSAVTAGPVHNRAGAVFIPNQPEDGTFVAKVLSTSPAYLAGLREGDILVSIDDRPVRDLRPPHEKSVHWSERPAGSRVKLNVTRNGAPLEVVVVLADLLY